MNSDEKHRMKFCPILLMTICQSGLYINIFFSKVKKLMLAPPASANY